jgi:cellulose synthase/poly-beta-1,6-N-acetylglucosamine synthase-like glycosyltransferase
MKVQDIEIPYENQRSRRYRFFEILPGVLTWSIFILPFVLAFVAPHVLIFIFITYILLWFVKSVGMLVRNFQGLKRMEEFKALDWRAMDSDLQNGTIPEDRIAPDWHKDNLHRVKEIKPNDVYHAIIIAAYNETREVLEPTIQSVLDSNYDMKKVILVLAYEGRDGAQAEQPCLDLAKEYGHRFGHTLTSKHPFNPKEVRGKGGNITYAARELEGYLQKNSIDPMNVIVTTLDSDNRPHKEYLASLTYLYVVCPDPLYASFQPVPIYTNNIWDAPAPMRVIATGNSFWNIVLSMRPHMIRNFSSHAQGMAALIKTDYWSVRTVVEDGHQFWRTYFRFDGKHEVYPLYLPIYQDAVFSSSYLKTLKMQFIQIRRWAWGASDIAYVVDKGFFSKNKVPKKDLIMKLARLTEGHISWATSAIILLVGGFIPQLINPLDYSSNQLPILAGRIQTVAMVGILATLYLSLKTLPPKPARYKRHRTIFMVLQWVLLPVTTILYNACAAINAQTRLMFGRYLDKFDVTDKATKTIDNKTVI